ncbi:MAG: hypothetical protein HUJ62_01255, partial [Streptococcus gallolyticus]|nr:hypothetical protein [Streptococcus gallolyticus]
KEYSLSEDFGINNIVKGEDLQLSFVDSANIPNVQSVNIAVDSGKSLALKQISVKTPAEDFDFKYNRTFESNLSLDKSDQALNLILDIDYDKNAYINPNFYVSLVNADGSKRSPEMQLVLDPNNNGTMEGSYVLTKTEAIYNFSSVLVRNEDPSNVENAPDYTLKSIRVNYVTYLYEGKVSQGSSVSINTDPAKMETPYEVKVKTLDYINAGTNADIYINIKGKSGNTDGQTGPQELDNGSDNFEQGDLDGFIIKCPSNITDITSIDIEGDCVKEWALDYVSVRNLSTNQEHTFKFGRWLNKEKITLSTSDITYNISIKTMDEENAGSTLWAKLDLYDENKQHTGFFDPDAKMDRAGTDTCSYTVLSTDDNKISGNISSIHVKAAPSSTENGTLNQNEWMLDKVAVSIDGDPFSSRDFVYRAWLKTNQEVTLNYNTRFAYDLDVSVGDFYEAGTDSDCYANIIGLDPNNIRVETGLLKLVREGGHNDLARGS